jgi:hypothetical protein
MNADAIKRLNDHFRTTLQGGRACVTKGVIGHANGNLAEIVKMVREYDHFNRDNDPWGEHDFGSFMHNGRKLLWKIDYYDHEYAFCSNDPANPSITRRVLTIMMAHEY